MRMTKSRVDYSPVIRAFGFPSAFVIRASSFLKSHQKRPGAHHLLAIEPDVEVAPDAVDVGLGNPICARMLSIGMTEGDVDAGNFLVLQNVSDDVGAGGIGAD